MASITTAATTAAAAIATGNNNNNNNNDNSNANKNNTSYATEDDNINANIVSHLVNNSNEENNLFINFCLAEVGLFLIIVKLLPVDMAGRLMYTSKSLQRIIEHKDNDFFWKFVCKIIFKPPQYYLPEILPSSHNSWRSVFMQRPYAKLNGYYCQEYKYVRRRQAPSMWDEVPAGQVLWCRYYRYLYFNNNGEVLYCCSPSPPEQFERKFNLQNRNVHKGSYRMRRKKIIIEIPMLPSKEVCVVEVETKARGWNMETIEHILKRDPELDLPPIKLENSKIWYFHRRWSIKKIVDKGSNDS